MLFYFEEFLVALVILYTVSRKGDTRTCAAEFCTKILEILCSLFRLFPHYAKGCKWPKPSNIFCIGLLMRSLTIALMQIFRDCSESIIKSVNILWKCGQDYDNFRFVLMVWLLKYLTHIYEFNPFMPRVPQNGTPTLTVNHKIIQALMG